MTKNFRILCTGRIMWLDLSMPAAPPTEYPVAFLLSRFGEVGEFVVLQPVTHEMLDAPMPLSLERAVSLVGQLSVPLDSSATEFFIMQPARPKSVKFAGTFYGSSGLLQLTSGSRMRITAWIQIGPPSLGTTVNSGAGAFGIRSGLHLRAAQTDWQGQTIID